MRMKRPAAIAFALALLLTITSLDISCVSAETATITGATAYSYDFKTITLSWEPVVIEKPVVPDEPEPEPEPVVEPESVVEPEDGLEPELIGEEPVAEPEEWVEPEVTAEESELEITYEEITYKIRRAATKKGTYKVIGETDEVQYVDKGLKPGKAYYYRIEAYGSDGEKVGKSAIVSTKVRIQKTASITLIKKGDAWFNFRKEAGEKLYRYDTLQGACANDGHAYLTLYNRKVEKCKIVKVNLETLEIEKVSKPLAVYHANGMTYNTKKNLIAVACCRVKDKRIVLVDPKKLTVKSYKDIKLTSKVKNLPWSVRLRYKGFTAIAYNEKNDIYIGRLRDNNNAIIFDGNLKPIKYVKLSGKKAFLLNQGMDSKGNYIYDVRSFKGKRKYSMVTIHTIKGKFVGQIKFPFGAYPGNELQCIFHDGDQFYAGFYRSTSQKDDTQRNHVKRYNKLYTLNNL